MKIHEAKKMLDALYNEFGKIDTTDNAQATYDFVLCLALQDACANGSDASEVEVELLDSNLCLDGINQRQYYTTIMSAEAPDIFDVDGAKKIWVMNELKNIADFLKEEI